MVSDLSHSAPAATPRPQALAPGVLPAIRQSADRLARDEDAFIRQLHRDVTRLIPASATPPHFNTWMFCDRMVELLLWTALAGQPPRRTADAMCQVGAQNWHAGFPESQYANVAHALVQTVHYLSGPEWSASTGSAWISYFMWIEPHLTAGAQQAAAQQVADQRAAERQAAAQRAAAHREAARVEALARDERGSQTRVVGDVNLESVATLLDDDDDADVGYGQIMVSMTRQSRRDPPRHRG
jgi:hypothetical protein